MLNTVNLLLVFIQFIYMLVHRSFFSSFFRCFCFVACVAFIGHRVVKGKMRSNPKTTNEKKNTYKNLNSKISLKEPQSIPDKIYSAHLKRLNGIQRVYERRQFFFPFVLKINFAQMLNHLYAMQKKQLKIYFYFCN